MDETIALGFKYVADKDSRSIGTSHPDGNLWDNGADAIAELEHLLRVREIALNQFSERNVRIGRPLAMIEEALVPIYLLHRFQIEAVGKLIGGEYFSYRMRGDGQAADRPVPVARQQQAIDALLGTLDPAMLRLPQALADEISPRVPGVAKTREAFSGRTGINFDALAPAEAAVALTLRVLLEPSRAARARAQWRPGLCGCDAWPARGELVCARKRAEPMVRFSARPTCRCCMACWVSHLMRAPTRMRVPLPLRPSRNLERWLGEASLASRCNA